MNCSDDPYDAYTKIVNNLYLTGKKYASINLYYMTLVKKNFHKFYLNHSTLDLKNLWKFSILK